jgi:hypothetical protein
MNDETTKKKKRKLPIWLHRLFKLTEESKGKTDVELDAHIAKVRFILKRIWPEIRLIIKRKISRFIIYQGWKALLILSTIGGISYGAYYLMYIKVSNDLTASSYTRKTDVVTSYPKDSTMVLENYMKQIAYCESRYNHEANRPGSQYWGLYQIGTKERSIAGYGDITYNVYMNHPEIQHMCMINLLRYNQKYMDKYIKKYSGRIIDGILITESGILALCHIGCGYAQRYLDSGVIPEHDENGNSPRQYAKLGGYNLNLEKYNYDKFDGRIK